MNDTEIANGDIDEALERLESGNLLLEGLEMDGICLDRRDLRDTCLNYASLRDASFNNANLDNAEITGADFSGADFSAASLCNASLSSFINHTVFYGADLTGAKLSGYMSGADFSGANMNGTSIVMSWQAITANFSNTKNLERAVFKDMENRRVVGIALDPQGHLVPAQGTESPALANRFDTSTQNTIQFSAIYDDLLKEAREKGFLPADTNQAPDTTDKPSNAIR